MLAVEKCPFTGDATDPNDVLRGRFTPCDGPVVRIWAIRTLLETPTFTTARAIWPRVSEQLAAVLRGGFHSTNMEGLADLIADGICPGNFPGVPFALFAPWDPRAVTARCDFRCGVGQGPARAVEQHFWETPPTMPPVLVFRAPPGRPLGLGRGVREMRPMCGHLHTKRRRDWNLLTPVRSPFSCPT